MNTHFIRIVRIVIIQMFVTFCSFVGDEILAVNGKALHGLSHQESISVFKDIKSGAVTLYIGRRLSKKQRPSIVKS